MLCAISGEAPQEPVASKKSGTIFEKRLIESYIADNNRDPVTGEDLAIEDLVPLKSERVVKPRPPTLTSIPSLLSVFQNEWDAITLESYNLKLRNTQLQQELSAALYATDASKRVIARMEKERDEAREALTKVSAVEHRSNAKAAVIGKGAATNGDAMQVDDQELPEAVQNKINETHSRLSSTRRKRETPQEWAIADDVRSFKPIKHMRLLPPSSRALALDQTGNYAFLGGTDGSACIYSFPKQETVRMFDIGDSAINDLISLESGSELRCAAASADGSVRIFENDNKIDQYSAHSGNVTALSAHPAGELIASVGEDKSFVMYSIIQKEVLSQVYTDSELSCCEFHPDGHLLGTGGASGQILVFDVKSGTSLAQFPVSRPISALSFSENGLWLAAATKGSSQVAIFDLKKATEKFTLDFGGPLLSIQFDYSGQFLAGSGPGGITVQYWDKASKEWNELLSKAAPATVLRWGPLAKALVTLTTNGEVGVLK